MIAIISPAKSLDFEQAAPTHEYTIPDFMEDSEKVIKKLRSLSRKKIRELMKISQNLAELNYDRYAQWDTDFNLDNAKQAMYAFKGDVYIGLAAEEYTEEDIQYAQDHLRILSGLHGLLRPLDLIQPYRLEMGTSLPIRRRKNLYDFWDDKITKALNEALEAQGDDWLINLASREYFKAVRPQKLKGKIIDVDFNYLKGDNYTQISFFAKKARGMMSSYLIKNRITSLDQLKEFDVDGYYFNESQSEGDHLVFSKLVE